MTYEELVKKVKQVIRKIDTRAIKQHAAIEIDIEGEGEGAFYVELDKDKATVEPFEYFDNDCKIRIGSDVLMELISGKVDAEKVLKEGKINIDGNIEKLIEFTGLLKTSKDKKERSRKDGNLHGRAGNEYGLPNL